MDEIAGSGNDEFYTPEYAIKPLLKYIPEGSIIWCPFDTEKSLFIKIFKENGYNVISSHLDNGEDFFTIETPKCDYIISNPPYSLKGQVFDRLFKIKKPFAMLVGVVGLFESKTRFNMFKNNPFEIMYFDKRISYFKSYTDNKPSLNPPFSSVYLCQNMLPQTIMFEVLDKSKKEIELF